MANGLGRFLLSSLGKKLVVGLTGFLLVGFLIMHLVGNLTLYADTDGEKFVSYADGMHALGPLMYIGEVALVVLFGVHIWMALRVTMENRRARPRPYTIKATLGESTPASRSMHVSGIVVLGFLIIHLIDFRFSESILAPPHGADLFETVVDVLSNPLWGAIYFVGSIAVGVHVSHGFRSAFQSFGANHPRFNRLARRVGAALALILGIGFASFPLVALVAWR